MYEFEKLIGRVEWIRRYKTWPFLEERNAFLLHLRDPGYSALQLRTNNKYMLIDQNIGLLRPKDTVALTER